MQLTNSPPNNRQIPQDEKSPPITFLVVTFFVSFFVLSILLADRSKPCNDLVTLQILESKIDSEITLTNEERITYCRLLEEIRGIYLDNCESLDFRTVFSGGRIISQSSKRKHCEKTDYLFKDKNKALIWARVHLGHDTENIYDKKRGILLEWKNPNGDKVYWNHGDWGKGPGSSKFPHLNYSIGNCNGHLFLKDKIVNRGQWSEFARHFNL
jgi:hypothetical protein